LWAAAQQVSVAARKFDASELQLQIANGYRTTITGIIEASLAERSQNNQ
jgi:hypothetical protein